jgi:hypothetical protein
MATPSQDQLKFILSVEDRASRAFRRIARELRDVGRAGAEARAGVNGTTAEFTRSAERARQASKSYRQAAQGLRAFDQGADDAAEGARQAEQRVGTLTKAFRALNGATVDLPGVFKRVGIAAGALAGPAAGAGAIGFVAVQASNTASRFEDLNTTLDTSVQKLDRVRVASRELGLGQGDLTSAITAVQDRVTQALRQGGGAVFQRLGLDQDTLANLREQPVALLRRVADAIRDVESAAARRDILSELGLGRRFNNLLEVGRDRVTALAEAFDTLGGVLSGRTVRAADRVQSVFLALWSVLRRQLIRAVADNADALERLGERVLARLPAIIDSVVNATEALIRNWRTLATVATTIAGAAIGSIFAPAVGAAGTVVGALAGAVTGQLLPSLSEFERQAGDVGQAVDVIAGKAGKASDRINQVADASKRAAQTTNADTFDPNTSAIVKLFDKLGSLIRPVLGALRDFAAFIGKSLIEDINAFAKRALQVGAALESIAGKIKSEGIEAAEDLAESLGLMADKADQADKALEITVPTDETRQFVAVAGNVPNVLSDADQAAQQAAESFKALGNELRQRSDGLTGAEITAFSGRQAELIGQKGRAVAEFSRAQVEAIQGFEQGIDETAAGTLTRTQRLRGRLDDLRRARERIAGLSPQQIASDPTFDRSRGQILTALESKIGDVREKIEQATGITRRYRDEIALLEQAGTRAFDRIGDAVTRAFVQGEDAAISFRSVARGVISEVTQSLLRLAAINPLKNALFGGDRATASDVGGLVGSLFNSGSSSRALDTAIDVGTGTFGLTASQFGSSGGGFFSDALGFIGGLFAKGGAFDQGVRKLESGGLLDRPTMFGTQSSD